MKAISLLFVAVCVFASLSSAELVSASPPKCDFQSAAPVNQSASGKVSAVSNDGFSLDVKVGDASSTIQFVIDAKTKVTGSVSVGASVNVEYRTDSAGRNIATAVVVQAPKSL